MELHLKITLGLNTETLNVLQSLANSLAGKTAGTTAAPVIAPVVEGTKTVETTTDTEEKKKGRGPAKLKAVKNDTDTETKEVGETIEGGEAGEVKEPAETTEGSDTNEAGEVKTDSPKPEAGLLYEIRKMVAAKKAAHAPALKALLEKHDAKDEHGAYKLTSLKESNYAAFFADVKALN